MNAEPTESESSQLDEMIEPTEHASESEDSAPDFELDDDQLDAVLESLLLVVDSPAEVNQLASVTGTAPERVEERLTSMSAALTARGSGMDLRYAGDGWRLYTRQEFAPYVEKLLLDGARTKLTRAALETLAVVAYRQPLTRARISAVRGVNVDGVSEQLKIVDASLLRRTLRGASDWLASLQALVEGVRKEGLDLLVIDSLDGLEALAGFEPRRRELFRLFEWLRDLGVTTFVIGERPDYMVHGTILQPRYDEDFLADGVLNLRLHPISDQDVQRRLRIVKLRATNHETGYLALHVAPGEFEVGRVLGG